MAEAIPLPPPSETSLGLETKKLGMWVFLGSEVMFFYGFDRDLILCSGSEALAGPTVPFGQPPVISLTCRLLLLTPLS